MKNFVGWGEGDIDFFPFGDFDSVLTPNI